MFLLASRTIFASIIGIASSKLIEKGSKPESFLIETQRFLYFTYGQNLPVEASTSSPLQVQSDLGRAKACKASSSEIVSIVFPAGSDANFLSSSSCFPIWIMGPYLPILAITGFQLTGWIQSSLSVFTLSLPVVSITCS